MRPQRLRNVTFESLPDDEVILVSPDRSVSLILNPMGGVVWDLCDGSRSVQEMAELICETLPDIEPRRVIEDVTALVSRLQEAGMVKDLDACGESRSEP